MAQEPAGYLSSPKVTLPDLTALARFGQLIISVSIWYVRTCSFLKVRVQKDSSDALFTPKIVIFKQTILNTAYVKTLEIFPSARESLPIQTSASRSVWNQSCLQCS